MLEERGVKVFEVSQEAEEEWTDIILSTARDNSAFMAACTPSRLNFEGNPSMLNPRSGAYGGGYGDVFGFRDLLAEWRAAGDFAGWELDETDDAS
jgi:cyclohexanone monooxygenase